jgi:peptide/nickel transport system ATP-binding protein
MEKSCQLKVSNLSVEYRLGRSSIRALDDLSLELPSPGDSIGLVGESGSGKSTLAMAILNLIETPGRITSGSLEFEGRNVLSMSPSELRHYRWENVSMIYQSAMDSLNPVRRVTQPIVEVLRKHKHVSKKEAMTIALNSLQEVGIPSKHFADYPHELSGGMRQRVVIALALALAPKLLIADEPTSALDVVTQRQILNLIKSQVTDRGLSLIFITHEISLLNGLVENIVVMFRGEIVEKGRTWEVLTHPKHPYTEILVASLLTSNSRLGRFEQKNVSGIELYDSRLKDSCKYVTRCKYAFERCRKEKPLLRISEGDRLVACHKYS